jgi:hypothetical protein
MDVGVGQLRFAAENVYIVRAVYEGFVTATNRCVITTSPNRTLQMLLRRRV